jgi:tetratricopeptide (TPR) repeat protein
MQVRADEPVPPRQLQSKTPADLETICLKCLHKELKRRYDTALALAEDLARFQAGEPVRARPVGAWERARKWARRYPERAALAALGTLLVLGLLAGGFWYAQSERERAEEAQRQSEQETILRDAAEKAEKQTRQLLADSYASTAQLAMRRGDWRTALAYLDKALAGEPRAPAGLRLEKVRAWTALGELAKAVAELEVLENEPNLTRQQRGLVLLWQGDIALSRSSSHADKALKQFEQSLQLGLPDAEAAYARGLLAPTSREAVKHLEEALRIEPLHQRASAVLGCLLLSLGRLSEAHDRIIFAKRLFPDDPTFIVLHASDLALEDKLDAARALLKQTANRWSKQAQAQALSLVETLHELHQFSTQMADPDASPWTTLPLIGRLVLKLPKGMGKPSPNSIEVLLPLHPTIVKSYSRGLGLAATLMLFGNMTSDKSKTSDKLKEFAEVLRVHPEGLLFMLYGQVLALNDRWAEAETAFLTAAETPSMVPVRRKALLWACISEWLLARQVNAKEAATLKARALENTRTLTIAGLGKIFPSESYYLSRIALDMKDLSLAHYIIAEWERQAPKDLKCLAHRAELELLSGAFGRAIEVTNQILKVDPKHKLALSFRKRALEGIRRQAEEVKGK